MKLTKGVKANRYQSIAQSIEFFLEEYPGGFHGEHFIEHERNYKVKAHETALSLLSQNEFESRLKANDYKEICKRALKIVNATNLVFPNEKMSLKDGLDKGENQIFFAEALYKLLFDQSKFKDRFSFFSDMLYKIGAAKWTIASYFLFIFFPKEYMFVKPTATKNAANLSAFQINYRSDLNWKTYKSVLDFSEYLNRNSRN